MPAWQRALYVLVASDVRLSLLLRNHWLLKEKYAELSCIDCSTLAQFAENIFGRVFVEGLVQGNITAKVYTIDQRIFSYLFPPE